MGHRITRRTMLKAAGAGATLWLASRAIPAGAVSPNEKLQVAVIGVGGRGRDNLNALGQEKEVSLVGLCDVDEARAGDAYQKFPQAKKYVDYRKMLDELDSQIDAVVVSTPDHTHFHPAMRALGMGKHLYCEKPMAHAVAEVRAMCELAREKKVATQLGCQRHAMENMHRVVELVQSGAIGTVSEVHAWVGGERGMPDPPKEFPPVPAGLNWDLWLGPAADRPYSPEYVPYKWRFWWDFGTGETGNWGCHILDIPYWALQLGHCTRVSGEGPAVDPARTPKAMHCRFEFPAVASRPEVVLHWYHTNDNPEICKKHNLPHLGMGVLFIGSEGLLHCEFGKRKLYPEAKFAGFKEPAPFIANSPGFYKEWIAAAKGGPAATCNFDYTGPMAETVLLGNLAYRLQRDFPWDASAMKAANCPESEPLLHPTYRKGWEG